MSRIIKHSINIAGHLTSVSLEQEFWDALKSIAKERSCSAADLITQIDSNRDGGLSSAIRVFVLTTLQQRSADESD